MTPLNISWVLLFVATAAHLAVLSSRPKRSRLTFKLSIMASTTKSAFSTALVLLVSEASCRSQLSEMPAYASVVVSMFFMTALVNPSISSGCFFLAILASDLEIIVRPFLRSQLSKHVDRSDPVRLLQCLVRHIREHDLDPSAMLSNCECHVR